MIYNFVRSAALAWLLHAGIGLVFDSGSEASADVSVLAAEASLDVSVLASEASLDVSVLASEASLDASGFAAVTAACAIPATEAVVETPSPASPGIRTLTVSPLSLIPRAARDAFDLRILPNAARALRSAIPTFAGAQP